MAAHMGEELSAYLDGHLGAADRERVESHLATCPECMETLEYLRGLVLQASALNDRPPEQDLWAGIAVRIGAAPASDGVAPVVMPVGRGWRVSFTVPQLAAAAVALLVTGGTIATLLTRAPATADPGALIAPASDISPVAQVAPTGFASYDAAIAELEQALTAARSTMDTATVRLIEQSLTLIDAAISQARAALALDPGNLRLNGHLKATLDTKLALLRRAVALPAS